MTQGHFKNNLGTCKGGLRWLEHFKSVPGKFMTQRQVVLSSESSNANTITSTWYVNVWLRDMFEALVGFLVSNLVLPEFSLKFQKLNPKEYLKSEASPDKDVQPR